MNVFFIIIDSLRQDHLGCYGNDWIRTPNLDAFAQFVDIAPTILDFLGFTGSLEVMQGKSLLPLIRSEVESIREVARIGVFN